MIFHSIANTQHLIFRLLQRLAVLWKKQSISFCTRHAPNQPLLSIPLQGLVTRLQCHVQDLPKSKRCGALPSMLSLSHVDHSIALVNNLEYPIQSDCILHHSSLVHIILTTCKVGFNFLQRLSYSKTGMCTRNYAMIQYHI